MLCEEGRLELPNETYIGYKKRTGRTDKPGVIFCAGFLSNLNGTKAVFLDEYCEKNNLSYLRFDYIGHEFSSGSMDDFSIGLWKENTFDVLDKLTDGQQILVGSSMGGWISLLVAIERAERVHSVLTISNAADIMIPRWELANIRLVTTLGLYWCKMKVQNFFGSADPVSKSEVSDEDQSHHKAPQGAPPLSSILNAKYNSVYTHGDVPITCPVRLLHGTNDTIVPYTNSVNIAERLLSEDVEVSIVKDADHRFSTPSNLRLIGMVLDELLMIVPSSADSLAGQ